MIKKPNKNYSFNKVFNFEKEDYKRLENLSIMKGSEKKIKLILRTQKIFARCKKKPSSKPRAS